MGQPRIPGKQPGKISDNTAAELEKRFRKTGFDEIESPGTRMPIMPDDKTIHTQSVMQLSTLIGKYTAWREFAEDQLIVETAKVNILEEQVSALRKKAFIMADGNVTERKAIAAADEKVLAKSSELTITAAYRDMLAGKVESFTNCLTTLSREVTLREKVYPR